MEENYFKNYGLMMPLGPTVIRRPKPISRWIKALCFVIGHKWGFAGISYMGPSFPQKCSRCKITKWFDKPTLRMRFTKWVDVALNKTWPLCKVGIHRYKSHYGYAQFGPSGSIRQEIYKCSCCAKIKTVTIEDTKSE